jgi:hypothetical protein
MYDMRNDDGNETNETNRTEKERTMAANDIRIEEITFGVEIECVIPETTTIIAGSYYSSGIQVPQLPAGWVAKKDISIAAPSDMFKAVEIVSPILNGADGLRQLAFVLDWLRSVGAKVNASCGFHVHTGFAYDKADQIARLVDLAMRHEKALYAASGTKSRETCGYCKSLQTSDKVVAKFKDGGKVRSRSELGLEHHADRYFTMNLTNIAEGVRPAAEYRVFSGTLSTVKAISFVRLALGITHKALSRKARVGWSNAANKQLRKGVGSNALAWLMDEMNWMDARRTPFGVIEGEGIPTLKETKAELVRLAEKYDGGATD